MKTTKKLAGLFLSCSVLVALSLRAQPAASTAAQTQQNFEQSMEVQKPLLSLRPGTNAPEIYEGENADVGEQHIMRLLPRRTHFEVTVDSEYLYTDNALLTQHPYVSSSELVSTIEAAFAPTPYRIGPGRFAPEIGYRGQWYDYGLGGHDVSAIDFNVQSALVGGKYYFPDNWTAFAEFDYNWFFTHQNSSPMFYREFVPTIGAERLIQVGSKGVLSVGLQGDWHDSWQLNQPHNAQDRGDGIFSVAFAYQLMRHLVVQPYYRMDYSYYRFDANADPTSESPARHEFLNSAGVSAAWYFTPTLSLRTFFNYDAMVVRSDSAPPFNSPQYHDWNVGAELLWTVRF